jgi:hypothetical protein
VKLLASFFLSVIAFKFYFLNYSGTSIHHFSRGWRKQTMNAGKSLIRETITHCK